MALSSKGIELPELKEELDKVLKDRGIPYEQKHGLIVRFENDNTRAVDDAETLRATFEDIVDYGNDYIFEIPSQVYVVARNDKHPTWNLNDVINKLTAKFRPPATSEPRPSLCVFAYIGHGMLDPGTSLLHFANTSGRQSIPWTNVYDRIFQDAALQHVDAFGFLDCCFAGAVRIQLPRTSQVLSACCHKDEARPRTAAVTFTQRFVAVARSFHGEGLPIATVDALFQRLQNETPPGAPHAQLTTFGGTRPIALPIKSQSGSVGSPSRPVPDFQSQLARETHVLVKLTLDGPAREVTESFKEVLKQLPAQFRAEVADA